MTETTNDEIGVAAYDASEAQGDFVQVTLVRQPVRTIYLRRYEALLLAERIKRKADTIAGEKLHENQRTAKQRSIRSAQAGGPGAIPDAA
jgi:hypothetical protein